MIVRYLNYVDRQKILQQFRLTSPLRVEGHKLVIFADYSAEVSRKRRAFSNVCSMLHNNKVRFTLAYPVALRITTPEEHQQTFTDPEEAETFLNTRPMDPGQKSGFNDTHTQHSEATDETIHTFAKARPVPSLLRPGLCQTAYTPRPLPWITKLRGEVSKSCLTLPSSLIAL